MNAETPNTAVEVAKVEPQVPAKVIAPKVAKAKTSKVKKAVKATKQAQSKKAPGKAKAKKDKPAKASKAKTTKTKPAKVVPQGKFPRNKANPFRPGSAYASIFDGFIRKGSGVRRDELTALAMEATGKDAKHASYDLAVILSAKESNKGPRHPSCREGFWVKREGDCLTLMVD